jgi:hypothetical protein
MPGVRKVLVSVFVVALLITPALVQADPCLMVYSDGVAIYHYEPTEYYTVGPGDPLYDPMYDRGGEVLIDILAGEIAYDIYQVPGLAGFEEDSMHQGVFIMEQDFTVIVDGFNNMPVTYTNIILVFDLIEPMGCVPTISIDGNPALWDAGLGWYYPIGDLVVSTPADGMNYSDVLTFDFSWTSCYGLRVWAFADEDYDLMFDLGDECFSAYSHDLAVPTEKTSWGQIKNRYR